MTPFEQKQFLADIGKMMDRKLESVVARITVLEGVDSRHDRAIKDARREVVASKSEIVESTTAMLLAAARHNEQTIDSIAVEVKEIKEAAHKSIAPAAVGAERTGHRIEGKTDALAVGQDQIGESQKTVLRWQKVTAPLVVIIPIIVEILRSLLRTGGAQ